MLSSSTASKKGYLGMAAASFIGIMAAIPVSLALFAPDNNAGASRNSDPVSAAVAGAESDYANFAYAYTQGYLANAGTDGAWAGSGALMCSDDHKDDRAGGVGAVAASHRAPVGGFGNAPDRHDDRDRGGRGAETPRHWVESIRNSYNNYRTYVHNSSSVHNVNSNNTIGSHNRTETTIDVEDADDVVIGVSNSNSTHNNMASESFNEDSYNTRTETNTTIVNDSFNRTEDSNNTTNTAIVNDSNNTNHNNSHNNTEVDVDVDAELNVTDNSNQDNSTNIEDVEDAEVRA